MIKIHPQEIFSIKKVFMEEKEVSSKKLSSIIARVLDDKKASDILVLNVASVCCLSDYFVIASAGSTTKVKGLTSSLR